MERDSKGRFTIGRIETQEEKLKRSIALKEAWKTRKDYLGELKNKNPRIYNVWRAFMYTEKGKQAGHSEEWNSFKTFFNDVYPTYKEGYMFRRKDTTKPFSKDNFIWVAKEYNSILMSKVQLTYDGETHYLKEWSELLGISYNGLRQRYFRGKDYTVEEILFGKTKKTNRIIKDIRTISSEQKRRNKISKMLSAYRIKDKKRGYITNISFNYLYNIIYNSKCIYCGDSHNIGLDRIDNNRGHEIGNVVPCCYACNIARSDNFSFEEMRQLGKTIRLIKLKRKENETKSPKDC